MKQLILIVLIIVLVAPGVCVADVETYYDGSPKGNKYLMDDDDQAEYERLEREYWEKVARENAERQRLQREEERHQERMDELKRIEDELYRMRLEQGWNDLSN